MAGAGQIAMGSVIRAICFLLLGQLVLGQTLYGVSGHYLDHDSHLTVTISQLGDEVYGHLALTGLIMPFAGTVRAEGSEQFIEARAEDGQFSLSATVTEDVMTLFITNDDMAEKRRLSRLTPMLSQVSNLPLQRLLQAVPDLSLLRQSHSSIHFADEVLLRLVENAPMMFAQQDFLDNQEAALDWLQAGARRNISGLGAEAGFLAEGMSETTGYSFFSLASSLRLEPPPFEALLLEPLLIPDTEQMTEALLERGYTRNDPAGSLGFYREADFSREAGDPFRGVNGSATLIITQDLMLSSSEEAFARMLLQAYRQDVPSLADAPDYKALVDGIYALTADILQVSIYQPSFFWSDFVEPLAMLTDQAREKHLETQHLHPYALVALTDAERDGASLAILSLLYEDYAAAEADAPLILERIDRHFTEHFSQSGATLAYDIYNARRELYVLHVVISYAKHEGVRPGYAYHALLDAIVRRDFHKVLRLQP